jgi:hypothetical protein
MRIENGRAFPSQSPGLGIAWDEAEIARRSLLAGEVAA